MKIRTLVSILLVAASWIVVTKAETSLGRLRRKLLEGYDKENRPVKNDEDTVTVKFAYYVQHIYELETKTETLSTEGVMLMEWQDQFLVWDPKEYGNISYLHLADHEVWQPDIYLFRSVGQSTIDGDKSTFVRVSPEGHVIWTPPASLKVPCVTSYLYYPFEKHWCQLEFGSWSHNGDMLQLQSANNYTLDVSKVTGGEWRLMDWSLNVKEHFIISKYPYMSVNLTLTIQRTTSIHKITSVVPVVASSVLTLAGFWLDVWSTSRYILGLGNFGVVAFELMHLGIHLRTGKDIPLIVQYTATAACMAAVFMILTVLFDSMQSRKDSPPEGLVRFCRGLPEKPLCLSEETDRPQQESSAQPTTVSRDWSLVCHVFDRIFFWIFSIIYLLVTSLMFSVV